MKPLVCISICSILLMCSSPEVRVGLDDVNEYTNLVAGKRVGIITNHTAYNSRDQHIVDVFLNIPNVMVTALFGPEHGIRGDEAAGGRIDDATDPVRQLPIYSLYGKTRKPTPSMLANVDVLVFDIQDIGARFYTYISTMALAMEAAAENRIPFVVFDRPNPIDGVHVEGPVLDTTFASFVGLFPIPVRHGMTIGELATMIDAEGWLHGGVKAELTVVPVRNWQRTMCYDQTGLRWRKTSPNIPDIETAVVYPGMCLFEGTNVSEGRGTHRPFLQFGAPWIDAGTLLQRMAQYNLAGVTFQPIDFTPQTIPGMASHPKYEGSRCYGLSVKVTDRAVFNAFQTGVACVKAVHDLFPEEFQWRIAHFDRLCGTDTIRQQIENGIPLNAMIAGWTTGRGAFLELRRKYLRY